MSSCCSSFSRLGLYSLFRAQNKGNTAKIAMKYTDIVIIGGLAGSIVAAMLGRASTRRS
jgi:hypothetical protein